MSCLYCLYKLLNSIKRNGKLHCSSNSSNNILKQRNSGNIENTVHIQVYSAIIGYCLVTIVQNSLKLSRSTYKVLQILSISFTDKTYLITYSIKLISNMTKNEAVLVNQFYLIFNRSLF